MSATNGQPSGPIETSRRLGSVLEPVIGQVYFSPECHRRYQELGFDGSPRSADGVAMPDGIAYFCSRGSLLGAVPGQLVASAFAVFNPAAVVPSVTHGWTITDADTIRNARSMGAVEQLERILGPDPDGLDRIVELLDRAVDGLSLEGRPLAAGVAAWDPVDHRFGPLFRLGDLLREYRGEQPHRGLDHRRGRCGRDRVVDRVVLGPFAPQLHPDQSLVRR